MLQVRKKVLQRSTWAKATAPHRTTPHHQQTIEQQRESYQCIADSESQSKGASHAQRISDATRSTNQETHRHESRQSVHCRQDDRAPNETAALLNQPACMCWSGVVLTGEEHACVCMYVCMCVYVRVCGGRVWVGLGGRGCVSVRVVCVRSHRRHALINRYLKEELASSVQLVRLCAEGRFPVDPILPRIFAGKFLGRTIWPELLLNAITVVAGVCVSVGAVGPGGKRQLRQVTTY